MNAKVTCSNGNFASTLSAVRQLHSAGWTPEHLDPSTLEKPMGHDLHVTRKEFWCDETGPIIALNEWISYVQGDAEIRPHPENPGYENWVVLTGAVSWPLWWHETGELSTKNPGEDMIRKLISIAAALGARVLGDDEEIYSLAPSGAIRVERR